MISSSYGTARSYTCRVPRRARFLSAQHKARHGAVCLGCRSVASVALLLGYFPAKRSTGSHRSKRIILLSVPLESDRSCQGSKAEA